jgi:hypothetical protein
MIPKSGYRFSAKIILRGKPERDDEQGEVITLWVAGGNKGE